jgi:hypothetical protein
VQVPLLTSARRRARHASARYASLAAIASAVTLAITLAMPSGVVSGRGGPPSIETRAPAGSPPDALTGPAVLVGAGDIGVCGSTRDQATATLLDGIGGTVFAAGDTVYPDGSPTDYASCYEPSWGRHKSRTRPAPGNHEYHTPEAAGYFGYFGTAAGVPGQGWYAYDLGAWRIYVLNSNCGEVGGCGEGSEQLAWLRADLAANPRTCTAAIWHAPLFTSGAHGGDETYRPFWKALWDNGAEIVLNGHDHDYERFAPMRPNGRWNGKLGIREFVVGTGGVGLRPFATVHPNSQVRNSRTHGVLKLTLHASSYDWAFIPVAGATFTDSGTKRCH